MRMHSGVFEEKVWMFAGEEYSESKHVLDQVRGSIHIARCSSTSEIVFAVGEVFIDENWSELNGALIVLMGCSSLADTGLAEVMGDKGAIGVVGWSDDVSIEFSDETVLELMASLWKGKKLGDIVDEVNKRHEGLRMRYYPDSLGPFRLFEP